MIEVLYNNSASFQGHGSNPADLVPRGFSREEHMMKEQSLFRAGRRHPHRSQTHQVYQLPQSWELTVRTVRQSPATVDEHSDSSSNASDDQCQAATPVSAPKPEPVVVAVPRRPLLGAPRRSYSVMDVEPIPHHHRLSERITLMDLPSELHYAIFDFLDPIDSTCLGLTNQHFYAIHRRMHGRVPLSARRDGPNELEWAWHLAGAVVKGTRPAAAKVPTPAPALGSGGAGTHNLSQLRVRGQAYCRKCGITRCELHKHIQEWAGAETEYCSITQKFGTPAAEGSRPYCYMSKPGNLSRCGRHYVRRNKVALR